MVAAHQNEDGDHVPAQSKTARRMNGKGGMREVMISRHGNTKMNNDDASVDRLRGWIDVPLSADGKKEAKALAQKVKENPPDVLYASDLCRAIETAEIVAKACDLELKKPTKDFRPWNLGELAGQIAEKAVPTLAKYATETPDKPLPGDGESFNTFRKRFFKGLARALDSNDGLVGIVTHHRGERLLKAWIKGGCSKDGDVDAKEFTRKGEHTGHCEILKIPVDRLRGAAA